MMEHIDTYRIQLSAIWSGVMNYGLNWILDPDISRHVTW